MSTKQRRISIDALRGFDMFWLIGGAGVVRGLAEVAPSGLTRWLAAQTHHASWEGLTAYEVVFPLFLFLVGISVVLSRDSAAMHGGRGIAPSRIVSRACLIFVLGAFVDRIDGDYNIAMGVLQRIALCYLATALLVRFLSTRGLAVVNVLILVLYDLVLTKVPLPGMASVSFAAYENWPNVIDDFFINAFRPTHLYHRQFDPEGILSTFPAVSSTLLGVFAAELMKVQSTRRRLFLLAAAAVGASLLGWFLAGHVPIIKRLWTPSYVLVCGGICFGLLLVFHVVVDLLRYGWIFAPFVWIGSNALAVYVLSSIVPLERISALAELVVCVGLCWFLYRRRLFIRL